MVLETLHVWFECLSISVTRAGALSTASCKHQWQHVHGDPICAEAAMPLYRSTVTSASVFFTTDFV